MNLKYLFTTGLMFLLPIDVNAQWYEKLSVTGAVEIEAFHTETYDTESESDLVVATAVLGFNVAIDDSLSGGIVLLHEEDDTPLEVDEAFITKSYGNTNVTVGQIYLPFGQYNVSTINDPLTLELGETRETAVLIETERGMFSGALYLFNGDEDVSGKDTLTNYGCRLELGDKSDSSSWSVGLDYISNIADSDGLGGADYGLVDSVFGTSLSANWTNDKLGFSLEFLESDQFENGTVDFLGVGAKLRSSQFEMYVNGNLMGKSSTYFLTYNSTGEALSLELPESRISLGVGVELS